MNSYFNQEVSKRRNHTPWASVDFHNFAREMAVQGAHADLDISISKGIVKANNHSGKNDFILIVQYRPDTSSRFWFVARWTGKDGKRHTAEGHTIELCMWRAAQTEIDVQKNLEGK